MSSHMGRVEDHALLKADHCLGIESLFDVDKAKMVVRFHVIWLAIQTSSEPGDRCGKVCGRQRGASKSI